MTLGNTKPNFLVYGPISTQFFSFNWKFIGDSISNIKVYLKCLSEPQRPNFLVCGLISTNFFLSTGNVLHEILPYHKF